MSKLKQKKRKILAYLPQLKAFIQKTSKHLESSFLKKILVKAIEIFQQFSSKGRPCVEIKEKKVKI